MHDHTLLVLHPQIASTVCSYCEAVAGLAVIPREAGQIRQFVHLPCCIEGGGADAADADTADAERIALAVEVKRTAAATGAANIGRLDLPHVHVAAGRQAGDSLRTELGSAAGGDCKQHRGTEGTKQRTHHAPGLFLKLCGFLYAHHFMAPE